MRPLITALTVCGLLLGTTHAVAQGLPRPVEVVNLPETQTVDGTVEVSNFPAVQDVSVVDPLMCEAPAHSQLVGFTTSTFLQGGAGVLDFTVACQAQFADSKMCTSAEVAETVSVPAGLAGSAWVRPIFAPNGTEAVNGRIPRPGQTLSCSGYNNATDQDRSSVVDAAGRFTTATCDTSHSVACCAPVP